MKPVKIIVLCIIMLCSFCFLICQGQDIDQDSECLVCHQDVITQETSYTHLPFSQQNCIFCHIDPEGGQWDEKHGDGLRTRNDLGIDVCYICHKKENLGVSHPVGVYASGKIRIPDELPTGTGGRLLCITCHSPHGSNEESLGRKPVTAQLCIACHGEDYLK